MSHLEEGIIHALLDGEIPSAELAPIQAHLDRCETCRARLAEERELLDVSDRLVAAIQVTGAPAPRRTAKPSARPPVRLSAWIAWAATVVLAVGLGYAIGGSMRAMPSNVAALREIDRPSTPASVVANQAVAESTAPIPADPPVVSERATQPTLRRTETRRDAEEAKDLAQNRLVDSASQQRTRAAADTRFRLEEVIVTDTLRRAARPAAPTGVSGALRQEGARPSAAPGFAFDAAKLGAAAPSPIDFFEAIRTLGGSLRLVQGLVPERLERLGSAVRVVYRTGFGELILSQQLIDGRVRDTLIAPAGFPADSLEKLRGRVKE